VTALAFEAGIAATVPLVAFAAGAISILSPCCIPLLPGYLVYVSGVSAGDRSGSRRVLGSAALFVLGFAIVFTALGASASVLGALLLDRKALFIRISGAVVVLMGLSMLGVIRIPFLYREKRLDMHRIRRGPVGAVPLGMAFAFGWTPCIGPVLAGIFAVAASTASAPWGAFLLFVYSLGLGVPLLILAYAYTRAENTLGFFKRHARLIERIGGGLLVGIGLLLVTGYWFRLFAPLMRLLNRGNGWLPI
jgi:cytochrome c-type biogenesis protein